jgi:predicted ABC-type transport system involved in lysophospholipase L1 biosynthesis ATPase subunit
MGVVSRGVRNAFRSRARSVAVVLILAISMGLVPSMLLANQPKLILADKPTGNLDTQTGKEIFDLPHNLSRTQKTTIIAITHDLSIAGRADKAFTIADGRLV